MLVIIYTCELGKYSIFDQQQRLRNKLEMEAAGPVQPVQIVGNVWRGREQHQHTGHNALSDSALPHQPSRHKTCLQYTECYHNITSCICQYYFQQYARLQVNTAISVMDFTLHICSFRDGCEHDGRDIQCPPSTHSPAVTV